VEKALWLLRPSSEVDEVVESKIQSAPGGSERAAVGEVRRKRGIQQREPRGEHPAVGPGEEHGYAASEWRELLTVWQPRDQGLAAESAKIIGGLAIGVRLVPCVVGDGRGTCVSVTTAGAGRTVCASASHRRRLAESPTPRRAVQLFTQTRWPIPKSRVSLMTVSVGRALPSLKYCLRRLDLYVQYSCGLTPRVTTGVPL